MITHHVASNLKFNSEDLQYFDVLQLAASQYCIWATTADRGLWFYASGTDIRLVVIYALPIILLFMLAWGKSMFIITHLNPLSLYEILK